MSPSKKKKKSSNTKTKFSGSREIVICLPCRDCRGQFEAKKKKKKDEDEYSLLKTKLQNLIEAYRFVRANEKILLLKVKIRDIFQHLDTLCSEGSFPESLFDSDGRISSEDIFCAKCGSKDTSVNNDIILCDGFCDRGFHQYCVEPPLLTEDIPPVGEGWLCPGCDCKDDCLELLNISFGTKLSLSDSWEKVFPEAAAALAGGDQNLNSELPSDYFDDEEYDPNGLNISESDEDGSYAFECKNSSTMQKLYKIFKATKEGLQMTITQVNDWFKEGEGETSVSQNKGTSLESTNPIGSRKRRRL